MYQGPDADFICYQIETAKIGHDVLNDVECHVDCVNDDWYEHSFVTLSGICTTNNLSCDVSLLHIIFNLCVEIAEKTHQGTSQDITVVQCDQNGKDELWFKVKYKNKYTFAQCRYYIKTKRLEIHMGY